MFRAIKFLFGALVIVVLAAVAFGAWYVFADRAPAKPKLASGAPTAKGGPSTPEGQWHVVRGPSVFVGYRIKELFGDAVIKRDAVGRTKTVNGKMTIAGGRVTTAVVSADLSKIDSGREARDAYTRDNALESTKFPTARFTLTTPIALPTNLAKGQKIHREAHGTLLLHGVTRPVVVTIDARWNGPTVDAVGTAPIVLRNFGIEPPNTPIAKVDDHGSLELDVTFAPGAAATAG